MQIGISNFERKLVKNVVNRQHLQFTETWRHSKFGSILCKIRWEKHPRAFVKVVEGSEIYNFPIHHLVHFYSKFWSFKRSNRGIVARFQASWRRAATSRAGRAHARSPARPRCASSRLPPSASRGRPVPLDAVKFPPPRASSDRPVRPLLPSCACLPRWTSCYGQVGRCLSSEAWGSSPI
jgi:hypothetical protein